MSAGTLAGLAAELRDEATVISEYVIEPQAPAALGELVAPGPATAADPAAYATIVECVREGYLLHYGAPRLLQPPDQDLALLAGDYLYAKGLERLAALADLAAVRELADLISLSAELHADDSVAGAEVAAALWLASAVAIATGPSEPHERGKRALREAGSARPLYEAATEAAAGAGLDEQLAEAAETIGFRISHLG